MLEHIFHEPWYYFYSHFFRNLHLLRDALFWLEDFKLYLFFVISKSTLQSSMNVLEKGSERKWTYKSINYLCLKLFAIYFCQLWPDQAMDIFFPYWLWNKFWVLLFARLIIVKRVHQLLIGRAIFYLIDSAVEGIFLNRN